MKKLSFLLVGILTLVIISFTLPPIHIVGHWRVYHSSGQQSFVDFKTDGSYNGTTTEGKMYVSGKYTIQDDVVTITDGLCGIGYMAKYKVNSFGKDSVMVVAVEDSCTGRKASVDGASMKRLATKPQ